MWIVEEVSIEGEKNRWEVRLVSSVGMRVRSYPSDGTTPIWSLQVEEGLLTVPCTRATGHLEGHAAFLLATRWMNSTSHSVDMCRQGTDILKI